MALAYSDRFSRCTAGRPGFGRAFQASSRALSRWLASASYVAASGRGRPAGGMVRVRSFCATFSHTSGLPPTLPTSTVSSARPPVSSRSLWQPTQ